jgi:D-sedoheptulose 7-phosphate isomerase
MENQKALEKIAAHALATAKQALDQFSSDPKNLQRMAEGGQILSAAFRAGGKVISCGNGGSMCDAMHFAEELSGRFRKDRDPLPAVAINDAGHITCVANDFGYQEVFSRFVLAHGKPQDVLLGISTSGTSANVLAAVKAARAKSMKVIALTGRRNSPIGTAADLDICAESTTGFADRTQEIHIKIIHSLIEMCEFELFGHTLESAK